MIQKLKNLELFRLKNLELEDPAEVIKKGDTDKVKYNTYMLATGTFLVAASGFILYLDKVFTYFNITTEIPNDYYDFSTLVWTMCQTISPVLLILGANLKALRISYVIPLFCYSLQIFYIFFDLDIIEESYTPVYALGTTIALYLTILALSRFLTYFNSVRNAKMELLETIVESDSVLLNSRM